MIVIRDALLSEVPQARRLRLEMLADCPVAFGQRLADCQLWDFSRWELRHRSMLLPDCHLAVATHEDDWVGQAGGAIWTVDEKPQAFLRSVYLTPNWRGKGIIEKLVARVEGWACSLGFAQLFLDVAAPAVAARRSYAKLGFSPTGRQSAHPLYPEVSTIELAKTLPASAVPPAVRQ